jgi:hypothetical protein
MLKFVVEIARGTTNWCHVLSIFIGSLLSLTFRVFWVSIMIPTNKFGALLTEEAKKTQRHGKNTMSVLPESWALPLPSHKGNQVETKWLVHHVIIPSQAFMANSKRNRKKL